MTHPDMRLVPVEPTEAMIEAYFDACARHGFRAHINATAAWTAMLAAAPHQPQPAAEAMTEAEVRQWIDACNHEPARQVLRDYLALRAQQPADDKLAKVVEALELAKAKWDPPLTEPDTVCEAGGQMDPVTGWLSNMIRRAFGIRSSGGRLKRMVDVIVAAEALAALKAEGK